ncbi:MAG TPA: response regulator [Labilithrix sp.]|nr:response regulator [Labilithrix sp.]
MAQPKILLIDDSALILQVTRMALENAGFAVATAMTVDEFETERRSNPPDLIIVDIQMPEIFGDDLASTIRAAYREPAPILFLSGIDEEELAERAEDAGVQGWVSKRAGLPALVEKVSAILGVGPTSA